MVITMINSSIERSIIARAIGEEIDDLVRQRHLGLVEEPDITSRIGQRLEDRFNGKSIGKHVVRVITETVPSRGPGSLEKPTGADLYIAISVRPQIGPEVTKGVLVQAKRKAKLQDWSDLGEQCRRMCNVSKKGSVVWLYSPQGVDTMRAEHVGRSTVPSAPLSEMFDAVLECNLGDKRHVPAGDFGDREALAKLIRKFGAVNGVWLELESKRLR